MICFTFAARPARRLVVRSQGPLQSDRAMALKVIRADWLSPQLDLRYPSHRMKLGWGILFLCTLNGQVADAWNRQFSDEVLAGLDPDDWCVHEVDVARWVVSHLRNELHRRAQDA